MVKSKFLLVECQACKNQQIVFNKPSSVVKCLVCSSTLCKPTGGAGTIKTKVIKVLG